MDADVDANLCCGHALSVSVGVAAECEESSPQKPEKKSRSKSSCRFSIKAEANEI